MESKLASRNTHTHTQLWWQSGWSFGMKAANIHTVCLSRSEAMLFVVQCGDGSYSGVCYSHGHVLRANLSVRSFPSEKLERRCTHLRRHTHTTIRKPYLTREQKRCQHLYRLDDFGFIQFVKSKRAQQHKRSKQKMQKTVFADKIKQKPVWEKTLPIRRLLYHWLACRCVREEAKCL